MQQFRPSRFEILPPVIKNLIIINGLFFLAQNVIKTTPFGSIEDLFALHTWQSNLFKPWQLVTHLFLHDTGSWLHIILNMLGLWMFGSVLESLWGSKRFLTFFFACGLAAALASLIYNYLITEHMIAQFNAIHTQADLETFMRKYWNPEYGDIPMSLEGASAVLWGNANTVSFGASGAVFGCLAAFVYLFPNSTFYIYFVLPVKAKWAFLAFVAYELISGIMNDPRDNVGHFAHLGGALLGLILVYTWNKRNRRTFY